MRIKTEQYDDIRGGSSSFLRLLDDEGLQHGYVQVRSWPSSREFEIQVVSDGLVPAIDVRLRIPCPKPQCDRKED